MPFIPSLFGASLSAILLAGAAVAAPAVQNNAIDALRHSLFPVVSSLDASRAAPLLSARAQRSRACNGQVACTLSADLWTPAEIDAVAATAPDAQAQKAVRVELAGVNTILEVYGQGAAPRYPEIDGPELGDRKRFDSDVATAVAMNADAPSFDPSLTLALSLLDAADRLDAVDRWTQYEADNRSAVTRARHMAWADYPYTAIVALGVGPDDRDTPLSARGKRNVEMAAALYYAHRAPFIIVSGGSVHPRRTVFVEAFEMRKALIERYNVPAEAIVVDPFARHTTTNLRNASRLLADLAAPAGRPALIVSNEDQISYVAGQAFKDRNLDVLGYEPAWLMPQTSPTTIPFRPNPASALVDPEDPLDP